VRSFFLFKNSADCIYDIIQKVFIQLKGKLLGSSDLLGRVPAILLHHVEVSHHLNQQAFTC